MLRQRNRNSASSRKLLLNEEQLDFSQQRRHELRLPDASVRDLPHEVLGPDQRELRRGDGADAAAAAGHGGARRGGRRQRVLGVRAAAAAAHDCVCCH